VFCVGTSRSINTNEVEMTGILFDTLSIVIRYHFDVGDVAIAQGPAVQEFTASEEMEKLKVRSLLCWQRKNIVPAKGIGHVNLEERMIWNHYDM